MSAEDTKLSRGTLAFLPPSSTVRRAIPLTIRRLCGKILIESQAGNALLNYLAPDHPSITLPVVAARGVVYGDQRAVFDFFDPFGRALTDPVCLDSKSVQSKLLLPMIAEAALDSRS